MTATVIDDSMKNEMCLYIYVSRHRQTFSRNARHIRYITENINEKIVLTYHTALTYAAINIEMLCFI